MKSWGWAIVVVVLGGGLVWSLFRASASLPSSGETRPSSAPVALASHEATDQQVRAYCAACHAYPTPDSFPRAAWYKEVEQGFQLGRTSGRKLAEPEFLDVLAYYTARAPAELTMAPLAAAPLPAAWRKLPLAAPGGSASPAVVQITAVDWQGKTAALVCECHPLEGQSRLLLFEASGQAPRWRVLAGDLPRPAHAEMVDLDGDGRRDILVACLGSFFPADDLTGSVVWLQAQEDGSFKPITLLESIGRSSDVQAADFNGDGRLDLVVAEFGWRNAGSTLLLENQTEDWSQPKFKRHVLDARHGAIHVPVADLNNDGLPDFVSLISQEHETVVAHLNDRGSDNAIRFRQETIYAGPHPGYGSSGIELSDIDGDSDLDVVYTNGDVLDDPHLLKPYHSVHWLENRGAYPFDDHVLASMPGVERAVSGDVDGDGDRDIVAVSYLPAEEASFRTSLNLDAVLLLEQTSRGVFERRALASQSCDHFACAIGDFRGDGRQSILVGNFWSSADFPIDSEVDLWTFPASSTFPDRAVQPTAD